MKFLSNIKAFFNPERGRVSIVTYYGVFLNSGTDRGYPLMEVAIDVAAAEKWIFEQGWPGNSYFINKIYKVKAVEE